MPRPRFYKNNLIVPPAQKSFVRLARARLYYIYLLLYSPLIFLCLRDAPRRADDEIVPPFRSYIYTLFCLYISTVACRRGWWLITDGISFLIYIYPLFLPFFFNFVRVEDKYYDWNFIIHRNASEVAVQSYNGANPWGEFISEGNNKKPSICIHSGA